MAVDGLATRSRPAAAAALRIRRQPQRIPARLQLPHLVGQDCRWKVVAYSLPCEEVGELKRAIAEYNKVVRR